MNPISDDVAAHARAEISLKRKAKLKNIDVLPDNLLAESGE